MVTRPYGEEREEQENEARNTKRVDRGVSHISRPHQAPSQGFGLVEEDVCRDVKCV